MTEIKFELCVEGWLLPPVPFFPAMLLTGSYPEKSHSLKIVQLLKSGIYKGKMMKARIQIVPLMVVYYLHKK